MRYYDIVISPQGRQDSLATNAWSLRTGVTREKKPLAQLPPKISLSSMSNKFNNLSALNIEIDIPVAGFNDPAGYAYIKIHGITLADIAKAGQLNGALIEVYAGFSDYSLPICKPAQAGLILTGSVWQAYGNWVGENISLDLIVAPATNLQGSFPVVWAVGQTLQSVVKSVLSANYPTMKVVDNTTIPINTATAQTGIYYSLSQFAQYVYTASKAANSDIEYTGIRMTVQKSRIILSDGKSSNQAIKVDFQDLIGQPSWLEYGVIQFKCPLRSDIHLFDVVELPNGIYTQSAGSFTGMLDKTAFNGNFTVSKMRHLGNFRQGDGNSWCTIFDGIIKV